jgi:hypothetical protein
MKLWLDDIRPAPLGWKWVKTSQDAINELKDNEFFISEISLDHDLGDEIYGTGYDVMHWIEEHCMMHGYTPPPTIKFHSANPVGIKNMQSALDSIKKYCGNKHG